MRVPHFLKLFSGLGEVGNGFAGRLVAFSALFAGYFCLSRAAVY